MENQLSVITERIDDVVLLLHVSNCKFKVCLFRVPDTVWTC